MCYLCAWSAGPTGHLQTSCAKMTSPASISHLGEFFSKIMLLLSIKCSLTTTKYISPPQLLPFYPRAPNRSMQVRQTGAVRRKGSCQHLFGAGSVPASMLRRSWACLQKSPWPQSNKLLQWPEDEAPSLSNEDWMKALRSCVACGKKDLKDPRRCLHMGRTQVRKSQGWPEASQRTGPATCSCALELGVTFYSPQNLP